MKASSFLWRAGPLANPQHEPLDDPSGDQARKLSMGYRSTQQMQLQPSGQAIRSCCTCLYQKIELAPRGSPYECQELMRCELGGFAVRAMAGCNNWLSRR